MKKILVILISLAIHQISYCQITMTENALPEAGYTYWVSADTLTAVDPGTASASAQVWDYSTLLEHYIKFPTYDSTNLTPFATNFAASTHYTYGPAAMYSGFYGGAPVGAAGMNNGYMFWRRDDTGFWIVGFRSDEGTFADKNVLYAPQELMIGTPATYGSVFNNVARWELDFSEEISDVDTLYVKHVTKSLTADAFGELTTPNGTFPAVLRIHEYLISVDSVYATLMGSPVYEDEIIRDTAHNYIFMDTVTHYPVCTIHADENDEVEYVEYYKGYSMSEVSENRVGDVNIYPNPTTGSFTITQDENIFTTQNVLLIVSDSQGRSIHRQILTSPTTQIELNTMPGVYFIIITGNDQLVFKTKLVITD